nr:transglutaminase-like cysteine peptidase [Aeromonas veronii]
MVILLLLWRAEGYHQSAVGHLSPFIHECRTYYLNSRYTLMELGVDEKKLRLAYVKAVRYNQFHMVTLYFPTPKADPLVLDNINSRILPGSKRTDLIPVYSFDAKSIWIMKSRREGTLAGSADRLAQWTSMKTRFSSEQLRSPRRQL